MKPFRVACVMALVVLLGSGLRVGAVEVQWSAVYTRFLSVQDGTTPLEQGNLLELAVATNLANVAADAHLGASVLNSDFKVWATGYVGDGTAIEGSFAISTITSGAGVYGQQIYLLAFNSAALWAGTGPALATANQVGVFTNPNWIFPAAEGSSVEMIDLWDTGTTAVVGQLFTGTISDPNLNGPGQDAAALVVPEPATVALAALGLLGIAGLRKK